MNSTRGRIQPCPMMRSFSYETKLMPFNFKCFNKTETKFPNFVKFGRIYTQFDQFLTKCDKIFKKLIKFDQFLKFHIVVK